MADTLDTGEHLTLTAEQVAEWLNVPSGTVTHLARVRELPAIMIGKHQRFRPTDVIRYVNERPLKE